MWAILGTFVASTVIIIIDVPPLLKKKLTKELWAFSILLLFGIGLSIAHIMRVKIPNPLDWIQMVFKPMSDVIFSFFK